MAAFQWFVDLVGFLEGEGLALSAALVRIDEHLMAADTVFTRREKKYRVLEKRRESLRLAGGADGRSREILRSCAASWDDDQANFFLAEVSLTQPYAPYELDFKEEDRLEALREIAELIGRPSGRAAEIVESIASARKAHRHVDWGRVAVVTVLGTVVMALGGQLAAPAIAAKIGAAAGLSGAAAVSHGLAVLGGGSLATGGAGMAGGLWLVTGISASTGTCLAGAGGTALLNNTDAGVVQEELLRLQTTYREVILRSHLKSAEQASVVRALESQVAEMRARLSEERELNEDGARRLKRLEKNIRAYEDAIKWMKSQADAVGMS